VNQADSQHVAADSKLSLRSDVRDIIEGGQVAAVQPSRFKAVATLSSLTFLALWACFTPLQIAPLTWIALVPLCQLLRLRELPSRAYRVITVIAFVGAILTLQWMRLGHWTMHFSLLALSFYLALYAPVFVLVSRRMMRAGIPLWITVPLVWTALEYARGHLLTGFSWYYLGHSQYQWSSLIQIADLGGAYLISFVVALANGAVSELVPASWLMRVGLIDGADKLRDTRRRSRFVAIAVSCLLVAASCAYGVVRMQPSQNGNTAPGPVIAVAQGNFTPELKHDPDEWLRMVREHDLLTTHAARLQPDLILWPETMFPVPDFQVSDDLSDADLIAMLPPESGVRDAAVAAQEIERWRDGHTRDLLANRSVETGAAVVFGIQTNVVGTEGLQTFNSAAFVRPDSGYVGRYDKMHRVIFGEYIPLKSIFPWLARLTPFGSGFGIDAGTAPKVFNFREVRFAPLICFEDTVPHVVRQIALASDQDGNRADVLVNLTNDGWFRGSSELDQHLITSLFRCIETRRPMVRAVNTGISAFIDANGCIREPEHILLMDETTAGANAVFSPVDSMRVAETGAWRRQCSAVMCGQLPLDKRQSLYLNWGDWFAAGCSLLVSLSLAVTFFTRRDALLN
jgi:apolipoprotein N-acyltransferase